jgi:hypothetical protein
MVRGTVYWGLEQLESCAHSVACSTPLSLGYTKRLNATEQHPESCLACKQRHRVVSKHSKPPFATHRCLISGLDSLTSPH